ncbi:rRNA biogenesis protein RRP5 [Silene latifolia]|uniref:rRNA biogenesis protein RRP5 n=1 Tax=Silene latifolia TaxID=37657 RepID=UPI003D784193
MAPPSNTKKRKSSETLVKSSSKPAVRPPPQSQPFQFDNDVDFPRGGGSKLSRGEREEVEAEVDAEYGNVVEDKRNKKKVKKGSKTGGVRKSNDDELGSLFGEGVTGKLPRFANKITLKNISPGMKLWGVITEVNDKDIAVTLPGGLRGLVRASEAVESSLLDKNKMDVESHFLSSLFHAGQLVSGIVLQVEDDKKESGKRKVWLSLRLALLHKGYTLDAVQEGMVMSAYVKSIEDHGYILDFGMPSFTGFMPKQVDKDASEAKVLVGQLIQGVVKNVDKTRKVLYLTSDTSLVSKCVTKDLKGFSLDLLVPGMMVNTRIQATLENGIMLSFLTYFTGTVDIFHLKNELHSSDWKKQYDKNMKVNARILFVDPSTRAVGLTMNPHLLLNKAPPVLVKTGEIYDKAKIIRIDKQWGLLLAIPNCPDSTVDATPAYVTVSDVSDTEVPNLEKKFKEGSVVRARILGFRHMEGLAMGVLKASAFEGAVFTHADVKPGMVVRAKVIDVKSVGATVQFPSGVKALCPSQHMSELEVQRPRKKFKVGADLEFRVLGCKSKRTTVTHKKTLVKSKLGILSSYGDATEQFITHGWITKIEIDRCFVQFYNGVKGIVPRSELGLESGCDPSTRYHVGQVVKCRVTGRAAHHINLSFIISPPKISDADKVKLGSIVSAVVEFVKPNAILLHVNVKGNIKGTLFTEHLADHQGQASQLKSAVRPGYVFSELLVLDMEGNNLILSAKYSLIHASPPLPADITQMSLNSVINGYVCNLIETGCFVRFLGRLTGFSPKKNTLDDRNVDISEAFYVGQSVRCNITDIDRKSSRISLSLKQSSCSSTDISFLRSFFLIESKIAELQVSDLNSELGWLQAFSVGSVVEGKISDIKDVGVVVSFDKYCDVFGFITQYQLGGKTLKVGSTVQAVVLDIAKSERLVDLSLKPDFVVPPISKKKRKREVKEFKVHERVNAVVEIVKEDYLVVSLPEYDFAIGYIAVADYNTQNIQRKRFTGGETIVANIMELPSESTGNRLLLLLESSSLPSNAKKAKKKGGCDVGSLVEAEITDIKPLELQVKFGSGLRGRVHITETNDENVVEEPFSSYEVGQILTAKIIGKCPTAERNKNACLWELSLKSSLLSESMGRSLEMADDFNFSVGQNVLGYVVKVDKEWVLLAISRLVKARLYILDSACEPDDLKQFQKRFKVGSVVSGYVLTIDKERKTLRLVTRQFSAGLNGIVEKGCADKANKSSDTLDEKGIAHFHDGDVVGGRVGKILPGVGGLLVQLGPRVYGKVHYTELVDSWISNPLSRYQEGQFVKCKVLEISHSDLGNVHIDLSLRSFVEGSSRFDNIEELEPGMEVKGYVKSVTPKGCFVLISRNIDAKILISNLSDEFIKDPAKEFPVGKLVSGKILSVEPLSKRVEVTLKVGGNSSLKSELSDLNVGDVIKGRIKRVESFGLFIVIDNTKLTGLCHVSEVSDDHIDNLEDKFRAGDRVIAKIKKLDVERQRISLGMKSSDLMDEDIAISSSSLSSDEGSEDFDAVDDSASNMNIGVSQISHSVSEVEHENELAIAQVESRASVPPLEVTLDDVEEDGVDERFDLKESQIVGVLDEKNKRRAMKKAKEDRELEIRAAEQRLLEKDAPKTTDEFEKVVRTSPNNSFVWIKFMQFMLSTADVEGARSVAERALKTINITYETEKLNVWVAYLNLENQYGNPREEAVTNLFQRALQYCDPLKLHLELLGLYERTEQHKLADELLGKMVKKFKQSFEVWLRQIQWLMKQKPDEVDNMIKRALLSLPYHEHIKFLSQAAILEFKIGIPDRGRSTFEKMLREYPKRTDLWSVYLDQEIRLGDADLIHGLFERATSLSLPPKKMNFLFKKYLGYEKSVGDEERIEHVRQKAKEYADSAAP